MYVDLHCDTIIKNIGEDRKKDMYENDYGHLDLKSLLDAGVKAQYFAIYLYDENYEDKPALDVKDDRDYVNKCLDYLNKMEAKYGDEIGVARNFTEYEKNKAEGKMSMFYSIENGRVVDSMETLEEFNKKGISLITLLWNHETHIGFPNSMDKDIMNSGLKDFGKEMVEKMNDLKMVIDVSHLSDGGFWDVHEISKAPFVASHSNARELSPHPRNLTDDMIKATGDTGGLIGLNLFSRFLSPDIDSMVSKKSDLLKHVKHIMNVGGEDVLAVGTDFDGIDGDLEISSPEEMNNFLNSLTDEGIPERVVEKMAYKNFEVFYTDFCK